MRIRDPKPEIQRLEALVNSIRSGEIKLPKFQRAFVWSKNEMLDLLDSIYNGYPIGSILLWHSSERLKSERAIDGFEVSTNYVDTYPTDYLLDGQQRLTTLCGSLFWEGSEITSIWRIFFDLDTEKFVHHRGQSTSNLFPVNKLLKTSDFIKQCMSFEASPNARKYYENAEKLLSSIKDYKIAVVKIGDTPLDEVGPIFERINSTGRKLTMVDLMRAATWKDGFDLGELIKETTSAVREHGFGDITDTDILRSIAAAAGFGINKEDIDKLRHRSPQQITEATLSSRDAMVKALHFLRANTALDDLSFLPYGLQLAHLVEFFRIQPNPNSEQTQLLVRWFWSTSVNRYFAGASTGQNSRDLENTRKFAGGHINAIHIPKKIDISSFLFDQFNLRNATSTAFGLLLKSLKPTKDLHDRAIDQSQIKKMERHIFGCLSPSRDQPYQKNVLYYLNPFGEIYKNGNILEETEVLHSHFLNPSVIHHIKSGTFGELAKERAQLISHKLESMLQTQIEYDTSEISDLNW
jgi:hypothetical protein